MKNDSKISRAYGFRKSLARLFLVAGPVIASSISGASLAQTALSGSDLVLPTTAPPTADMVILKTESTDHSGSFSVVVTNTGPVAVTGAAVTDKAGVGGFCPKGNAVTITGNGAPEGSLTVTNLSSPGIALGTLQPGQSATLIYSCAGR